MGERVTSRDSHISRGELLGLAGAVLGLDDDAPVADPDLLGNLLARMVFAYIDPGNWRQVIPAIKTEYAQALGHG